MAQPAFQDLGRKRTQREVPVARLHLDRDNPRLPEATQGKSESEVLRVLSTRFNLVELAESMAKNGYFAEEPLVGVPQRIPDNLKDQKPDSSVFSRFIEDVSTEFVVVEGNRRLATAKILLDPELRETLRTRSWPEPTPEILESLQVLPVIIYKDRNEVTPYLGVRHIVGIQKWDAYAKARYLAKMIDQEQHSIAELEDVIGDKRGTIIKTYVCYKVIEQAEEELDLDMKNARDRFSLLLLSVGNANIKRFLGLPRKLAKANGNQPIPSESFKNLQDFLLWVFGNEGRQPIISDSRQITSSLSHVLASPEAVTHLRNTNNLLDAYERSDGEEVMILKYLATANTKLESALSVAHRHRTQDVALQIEKAEETVKQLQKVVSEQDHG